MPPPPSLPPSSPPSLPPFLHSSTADASAAAKYDAFVKWLLDNGAQFPGLELRVRDFDGLGKMVHKYCRHSFPPSFPPSLPPSLLQEYEYDVRGVHAKEELKGDQVVVEIPLKCLITVEMGKETEIGKAVLASNLPLDAPKHIFLMLFMLTDRRNPASFFKVLPLLLYLPPSFSPSPILLSFSPSNLRPLSRTTPSCVALSLLPPSLPPIPPSSHTTTSCPPPSPTCPSSGPSTNSPTYKVRRQGRREGGREEERKRVMRQRSDFES